MNMPPPINALDLHLVVSTTRNVISKCGITNGIIVFNISHHVVNIFKVKYELLEIIFHSSIFTINDIFNIVGGAVSL